MNTRLKWGDTRIKSTLWALLGLIILFSWDLVIVKNNYGGNCTSLFRTGDHFPVPSVLREKTFIFSHSPGYDGQFYRYVALDPFWRDHNADAFDSVPRRYPRVLIPLIAYLLAGGNRNFIDFTYFFAVGLSIFLGGFWLSLWAASFGRHEAWGLAFVILPSTLISATMMTVDVGVLALSMAFGYFMERKRYALVYPVVLLAPLCSETGALLLAGACLWLLINRKWRLAFLMGSAGFPALGWHIYVQKVVSARTGGSAIPGWLLEDPVTGIFQTMASTLSHSTGLHLDKLIAVFDLFSLGATVLAFVLMGLAALRKPLSPIALTGCLFIPLAIIVNNRGFWAVPIGYLRPFSVLFAFLLMLSLSEGLKRREILLAWISLSLISLRVMGQFIYTEFFRTMS